MSEEPPSQPGSANHSEERARLECEKLRAEIKAIGKPLHKTPGFYSAVAPVALALLGLIFTWSTGWFDVQRTRVNNDKTLLEAQTERLRMERTALETQTREQQARLTRAEDEMNRLKEREASLTNQVARLDREREELRSAKELLECQTKRLAGADAKAIQFLEQLKSLQADRERMLGDAQTLQTSNTTLRSSVAQQVALIRWANNVLSEGWMIALQDKLTWTKFRNFGGHVLEVREVSRRYLPEDQADPYSEAARNEDAKRTYDDDLLREIRRTASKTAEDYLRDAQEQFALRPSGTNSGNIDANGQGRAAWPAWPDRTPRTPRSPR